MARKNKWTVEVDGVEHSIEYKKGFKSKLIINDDKRILKSRNPFVVVIDETIDLVSKKVQLVVIGSKADLAVDGVFLNSKKEYAPIDNLPKWVWVFVGMCMIPLIVCFGGALNAIFGLLGAMFCINNTLSLERSTALKVILNIVITVLVWCASIIMITFVASAL